MGVALTPLPSAELGRGAATPLRPPLSPPTCRARRPGLPAAPGGHSARRAGCGELAEHVSAVNKAPGMFRGELGRFRHSALIAASPGRGTRAGRMCFGAARPNCSHLSRSRPPGGERAARKRLRPQSERRSCGIDGRLVRRRPPAVNPRAGRPVDASRPSRVPAAAREGMLLARRAEAARCRASPGQLRRALGEPSGGGSVGSGPGTALGRGGGGAGADGAPTAGKSALAVSLTVPSLLPLLTSPPSPVRSSSPSSLLSSSSSPHGISSFSCPLSCALPRFFFPVLI